VYSSASQRIAVSRYRTQSQGAIDVTLNLFSKFCFYLKANKPPTALLKELIRINDFLESCGSVFLGGERITHADCLLLPKLQHVLVAGKAFRGSLCLNPMGHDLKEILIAVIVKFDNICI